VRGYSSIHSLRAALALGYRGVCRLKPHAATQLWRRTSWTCSDPTASRIPATGAEHSGSPVRQVRNGGSLTRCISGEC
jgi:hypothetical protein